MTILFAVVAVRMLRAVHYFEVAIGVACEMTLFVLIQLMGAGVPTNGVIFVVEGADPDLR
jgi:hypothetical protein